MARAAALAERGVGLACYEAALLVENGLADSFRPLVVVAASLETQRARLMARDGMTAEAADELIATQLPLADKTAVADFVIHNDGTPKQLVARADEVLDAVETRVGKSVEAGGP